MSLTGSEDINPGVVMSNPNLALFFTHTCLIEPFKNRTCTILCIRVLRHNELVGDEPEDLGTVKKRNL